MPGDYSRDSFYRTRHYDAVLIEQGRVQLDADANEDRLIRQHRTETETIDVIGSCGAPAGASGFLIGQTPDGRDLTISPGRIYVEGLMCELEGARTAVRAAANGLEADSLTLDDRPLRAGEWVRITADTATVATVRISSVDNAQRRISVAGPVPAIPSNAALTRVTTYATQPDLPDPPFFATAPGSPPVSPSTATGLQLADGTYIVYLDTWHREITALDDSHLREVALGGPDTAARLKTVWQVRILPVDTASPSVCSSPFTQWDALTAPPTGRMNARTVPSSDTGNPCELPPQAGFLRLENQLYRVEVHRGGSRAQASFKWSRENASVETVVTAIAGSIITVADLGKDDVLGFDRGQYVELVDDGTALGDPPRALLLIASIDRARREITIDGSVPPLAGRPGLKLRRWDQTGAAATDNGIAMTGAWQNLESGIQALFSEGTYRAGDFWLIPARTSTAEIEWPPFHIPNTDPVPQPPNGTPHHFCRLAILQVSRDVFQLQDCRAVFPPLTGLPVPKPGFHVVAIRILRANLPPLDFVNDSSVSLPDFAGIEVSFDRPPDPATIKRATCYLVVEVPLPAQANAAQPPAYLTSVLSATFQVNGAAARLLPTLAALTFLRDTQIPSSETAGILARFFLKGNFIWSMPPDPVYLDGNSFGVRQRSPANLALTLPSGDRAGGGDLESWFFLRPRQPRPPFRVTLLPAIASQLRAEGITELLGDIVLIGTDGDPTPAGTNVSEFDVTLILAASITNAVQNGFVDAVLLLCDDQPPFAPPARLNTTRLAASGSPLPGVGGNGINYQDGSAPNIFQGKLAAPNTLVFSGVPLDPGGDNKRILRIKNVRVNATTLITGGSGPAILNAAISISSGLLPSTTFTAANVLGGFDFRTIGPNNAAVPVHVKFTSNPALNQNSANAAVDPTLFVAYTEGFASTFKGNKGGFGSPSAVTTFQEAGWNNVGQGRLDVAPGSAVPVTLGRADSGTRLVMRVAGIPQRVRIFVTTRDVTDQPLSNVDTPPARAALVTLSGTPFNGQRSPGNVPLSPLNQTCLGAPILEIPLSNGAGSVEWEYLDASGASGQQVETLRFAVAVATLDVSGLAAPLSFQGLIGPAVPTSLIIPRFADIPKSQTAFIIP